MSSNKVKISANKITEIANAIRESSKATTNSNPLYTLDEMPEKIRAIAEENNLNNDGVTITVTTETEDFYGKIVSLTDGVNNLYSTFSNEGVAVFKNVEMEGELIVSVEDGEQNQQVSAVIKRNYDININHTPKIYGVYYDPARDRRRLNRTDSAALFDPPSPAVNFGEGSSPFDNIYPWSEMKIVEDRTCGQMVKIPKFYYKTESFDSGEFTLKISKEKLNGYNVCPICMDRGDGKGEREYAFVGRYHCNEINYKSTSNTKPKFGASRFTTRNTIHYMEDTLWQFDMSALCTIWMLYLVEFADFNCHDTIGFGVSGIGPDGYSAIVTSGGTDYMNYHTGVASGRGGDESGKGRMGKYSQYRYIEDLWGNGFDMVDGIRFEAEKIYVITNPTEFSDTENGIYIGDRPTSSGYISQMIFSQTSNFNWVLYPTRIIESRDMDCGGSYNYNEANKILSFGGLYEGGFDYYYTGNQLINWLPLNADSDFGTRTCRLMRLP